MKFKSFSRKNSIYFKMGFIVILAVVVFAIFKAGYMTGAYIAGLLR